MTAESLGPMRAAQDVMGLAPVPHRPDDKRQKQPQADARKRRAKAIIDISDQDAEEGVEAAGGGESGSAAIDDDPHTIDVKL